MNKFKVLHKDGKARVGRLVTPHGVIDTPNFNPVGTQATVKALTPKDLDEIGVQMVLANTYHLMLRPGVGVIKGFGGLHKFMGWNKPIMTDSGGFQVFSLGGGMEEGASKVVNRIKNYELRIMDENKKPRLNKINEEGVTFQSHLDGSTHILTPEKSMQLQFDLGADLTVAFDDHEYKDDEKHLEQSIKRTEEWAIRSLTAFEKLKSKQLMYGVIHGGTNRSLRIESARFTDKNFEAIAIGGIYGERKNLYEIIEWVLEKVTYEKVRHLLGVGEVEDLFNGVERGIDLFDCVAPMRRARNGSLYISPKSRVYSDNSIYRRKNFTLNIRMGKFINDRKPIDPTCFCYACKKFSKTYLHHLYESGELLYHNLATYHNVYFIINLMKRIRKAIVNGTFMKLKKEYMGM